MTRFVGNPLRGVDFSSPSDEALTARVHSDSAPRIRIDAGGRITWGNGSATGDVNLYRDSENVLTTDDLFKATGGLVTITSNGVPAYNVPNGGLAVDTTNNTFYFRSNDTWQQVTGGGGGGGNASLTVSDTMPVTAQQGDLWFESDTGKTFVYYDLFWVEIGSSGGAVVAENITGNAGTATVATKLQSARNISLTGDVVGSVYFDGSENVSISTTLQPNSIALGTDTTGDYVSSLVAGTGISLTNNSGESASPTISIGQAVGTSSSVQFAAVTAPLIGNASTASTLQTPRTISLTGDVSGSVSFNGSSDASITAIIQPNSVALGTDTTGNYVNDVTAGTGVTVTHTPGEGSSPTIAIGQAVGTSSSVQFAAVTAPLIGNASTASTLQTARSISLGGDLSGSVSFNGSSDVTITATVQPNSVALGTDTTGNYLVDLTQGTGVTITHTPGEGSNATIAIGQAVGTSSSVQFASVTAPLIGNASTSSALQTARTIQLTGDVSGSVSFNGSSDASISTTIQPNSVALGTDTTGNYVSNVSAGTGIAVSHTPGEGSTATVSIESTAWTAYSPTITADGGGFALNNGTLTGRYKQIGKTVFFKLKFVFGSTTAAGTGHWNFSLPATSYDTNFTFSAAILDNGNAWYGGIGNGNYTGSTSSFAVIIPGTSASVTTWASVGNGGPFIWGDADNITISGSYEAA